jgi:hypothetical protein
MFTPSSLVAPFAPGAVPAPPPRLGAAVYSRDGARVGTVARVFRAAGPGAAPPRYAFLVEPAPAASGPGPRRRVCLPASAIAGAAPGRVTLALTRDQLAA